MSIVSVVRCESYEDADRAVRKAVKLAGGIKWGKKVLLKPNLLIGKDPNKAVTTHPEVVRPLVKMAKGSKIIIGDSPGTWAHKKIANYLKVTGFEKIAKEENCKAIRFGKKTPVLFTVKYGGKKRVLHIEREVVEADTVVNVAKLKTHMVTIISSALKNMYGIIPGNEKQLIHAQVPRITGFSEAVASIWKTRKADFNVVDAVVGLDGNGPNYLGKPIKLNYIIAGKDPVAVDAVCARLMGMNPYKLVLLKVAERMGIGSMKNIEVVGDKLIPKKARLPSTFIHNLWPEFQLWFLIPATVPRPEVIKNKCISCGECARVCPVKCINVEKYPNFNRKECIKCFCCMELCPKGAIDMKFPWPFSLVMKKP